MARVTTHERKNTGRDLLCSKRGFRDARETKLAKCADQLSRSDSGKLSDEGRRKGDENRALAGKEFFDERKVVANLLGVAGTSKDAIAAEDAVLRNDPCISILYANGFDGALANALVAVLALASLGINGVKRRHITALYA